ncbi:hypothetical protein A2U01_0046045, partial [Trifolium medium]|nr:hypothetical protein [Trifolium medium]
NTLSQSSIPHLLSLCSILFLVFAVAVAAAAPPVVLSVEPPVPPAALPCEEDSVDDEVGVVS